MPCPARVSKVLLLSLAVVVFMNSATNSIANAAEDNDADKMLVFVGTYTSGPDEGVYTCELDTKTGALKKLAASGNVKGPSFVAIHPNHKFLYAVSEVADYKDSNTGAVTSFALDPATGKLTPLNHQSSTSAGPCHLVVDRQGKNVLVANYGGGTAAVLPIGADGKLAPASSTARLTGSSVNKSRQEAPHAHSINLDAANHFAFVADLGTDKVMVYRFDPAKGTITPNDPPSVAVEPGSGPRHFTFHPSGNFAYVINEMASTITALAYDAVRGTLKPIGTVSTLPKDFKGENTTAEVRAHPSGKFVYGSNRGHDSIAMFAVDPAKGTLTPIGHQVTGGKTPRNFNIDPDGKFLLAANQDSDTITVFKVDPQTGKLEPTAHSIDIPKPVCIRFLKKG
ncbi:MAG TPA: lactonase family protein [Pirellulales bacterium]|nr:lactonase family protein [Pirellulales bacterium]